MLGRNNAARTSDYQISEKSPAPAFIIEPSVPAACVSLLSLRSSDGSSAQIQVTPASDTKGNLAMLPTAFTLIEGGGRSTNSTPDSTDSSTSSAAHNTLSLKKRTPRASPSTDAATKQIRQKQPSRSRFWDTVLPTNKDSNPIRNRSFQPSTLLPQFSISPVPNNPRAFVPSRNVPAPPRLPPTRNSMQTNTGSRDFSMSTVHHADEDESNKMIIPCVRCGVRFHKPGHLNMHLRSVHAVSTDAVHPGPVPMIGTACRAERPSVARISKAMDVRPYGCPQCVSRFRRGSDRNRHVRMVHAKIRPFACAQCDSHFGRKSFLETHVSTVHEKKRPYRCHCGAAFGQRSSLTRHLKKVDGAP